MRDPNRPTSPEGLVTSLENGDYETALDRLKRLRDAGIEVRKKAIRGLKPHLEDRPGAVERVAPALEPFLTDEDRSVRLTTAKLLVSVAEANPGAIRKLVPAISGRLADEDEFYYVRARSAEALGYVALEYPADVGSPETLAELRVGLAFDEPEVKEKLAKAIEHVALGDPERLRNQVPRLAEHLDDESELIRYHLTTALTAVGCERPGELAGGYDALVERLADESEYVRGRALEALGLLARSEPELPEGAVESSQPDGEETTFVAERRRFALAARAASRDADPPEGIGTVEAIREGTEEVVAEITEPEAGTCPHCGLSIPEDGPPMCPKCGAPH